MPQSPNENAYDFPDEIWYKISSYCTPVDIQNLCLTNDRFHNKTYLESPSSCNFGINVLHDTTHYKSLSHALLSKTLLNNLARVLQNNTCHPHIVSTSGPPYNEHCEVISSFIEMTNNLPRRSVVISGSSMVQTILGLDWKDSDVDIYCTAESATVVRSWITNKANQILANVKEGYLQSKVFPDLDPGIDHVEQYVSMTENVNSWRETEQYQTDRGTLTYHPELLSDDEKSNIDLIVMLPGVDIDDCLEGFDIKICRSSFDGKYFTIPDLHLQNNNSSSENNLQRSSWIQHKTGLTSNMRTQISKLYMKGLYRHSKSPSLILRQLFRLSSFYKAMNTFSSNSLSERLEKLNSGQIIASAEKLAATSCCETGLAMARYGRIVDFIYHCQGNHDYEIKMFRSLYRGRANFGPHLVRTAIITGALQYIYSKLPCFLRELSHELGLISTNSIHAVLLKCVKRWFKYIDRGIFIEEISPLSQDQDWETMLFKIDCLERSAYPVSVNDVVAFFNPVVLCDDFFEGYGEVAVLVQELRG